MSATSLTRRVRGVTYLRMSSDKQEASIEEQREWAETATVREHVNIVKTFTDSGISGHATSKRSDFHAMLEFCKMQAAGGEPIDVIITWHPNRFSRADSHETNWYLWEFRQAGVSMMLTAERWINFEKSEDRAILGIEQEFHNHKYSVDLGRDAMRGKLKNAKAGGWNGGREQYGYRMTYKPAVEGRKPAPDRLAPDPETAGVVQWMFETYATGQWSLRDIATDLDARKVPTPTQWYFARGKLKARDGHSPRVAVAWTETTVRRILGNEIYLGTLVWNRTQQGRFFGVVDLEVKPVANNDRVRRSNKLVSRNDQSQHIHSPRPHEALVEPAVFDACQKLLVANQKNTSPQGRKGKLLLTRLLVCGHCGRRMIGRFSKGVPIYLCGSYARFGKRVCNCNSVPEAPLLGALIRKLTERFTPEFLEACRADLIAQANLGHDKGLLDDLARRLAGLDTNLARAARRALTEEDETLAATYRTEAQRLQRERDRLAAELDTRRRAATPKSEPGSEVDRALAVIKGLEKSIKRGTPPEIRAILRDHIEKVELSFDHEHKGVQTRSTFARGLIWLREDSPLVTFLSNLSGQSSVYLLSLKT